MEDIFNKDITVINQYFDKTERKTKYKVSYVKGFWSSSKAISINGTLLQSSDNLTAVILMNELNQDKQTTVEMKHIKSQKIL